MTTELEAQMEAKRQELADLRAKKVAERKNNVLLRKQERLNNRNQVKEQDAGVAAILEEIHKYKRLNQERKLESKILLVIKDMAQQAMNTKQNTEINEG